MGCSEDKSVCGIRQLCSFWTGTSAAVTGKRSLCVVCLSVTIQGLADVDSTRHRDQALHGATMQCSMQLLFHRSGLPSLAQLYSRKQLLARPAHLTCSGYWCRACCSTRPVSLKATGQVHPHPSSFSVVVSRATGRRPWYYDAQALYTCLLRYLSGFSTVIVTCRSSARRPIL